MTQPQQTRQPQPVCSFPETERFVPCAEPATYIATSLNNRQWVMACDQHKAKLVVRNGWLWEIVKETAPIVVVAKNHDEQGETRERLSR